MKEKFQRKEEKNERQSGLVEEATQSYLILTLLSFLAFDFANRQKMLFISYILLLICLGMVVMSIHKIMQYRR